MGKREYEAQKKAFDIINAQEDKSNLASIPEPLFYSDMTIKDPLAIEKLKQEGMGNFDNKIEIIIMDLIPGEDLATFLYRSVLSVAKEKPETQKIISQSNLEIDKLSINDLIAEVSRVLDFRRAGGQHRDEAERLFEEDKVKRENAKKIATFLKRNNAIINSRWLEKIENTVNILHKNNFYHRDLHERNVMISPDGEIVSILDFGSSKLVPQGQEDVVYDSTGSRRPDDLMIVKMWESNTTTQKEDRDMELETFVDELKNLKNKLEKRSNPIWEKIKNAISQEKIDPSLVAALYANKIVESTSPLNEDLCALIFIEAFENGHDIEKKIDSILGDRSVSITWHNKLEKISRIIKRSS